MYSHWIDIIWICLVVIPSTHVFSARRLLHTYHIGHWTNLWCVCSASLVESCDVLYYTFYNTFRNLTTVHSGNIKTHKKNDNNKIISNNISQVIFTSTTTRSKTTTTTPRSKTGTFLFGQSGFCAIYTEWLCCPLFGAMAEDVCKTVAFLAAYSDELVQLNKHTLEALLKSNRRQSAFVHYIQRQVFLVASARSVAFLPIFRHGYHSYVCFFWPRIVFSEKPSQEKFRVRCSRFSISLFTRWQRLCVWVPLVRTPPTKELATTVLRVSRQIGNAGSRRYNVIVLRTLMLSLHATCFQSQLVHTTRVFCSVISRWQHLCFWRSVLWFWHRMPKSSSQDWGSLTTKRFKLRKFDSVAKQLLIEFHNVLVALATCTCKVNPCTIHASSANAVVKTILHNRVSIVPGRAM